MACCWGGNISNWVAMRRRPRGRESRTTQARAYNLGGGNFDNGDPANGAIPDLGDPILGVATFTHL